MLSNAKSRSAGKKILVTGASGFVGLHLIKELQKDKDVDIYAAVYKGSRAIEDLLPKDHIIQGNLTDVTFTDNLIEKVQPDLIYHLASLSQAYGGPHSATAMMSTNITLQYNLLEAIVKYAPRARLLAVCSANEYGLVKADEVPIKESQPLRPLNAYAVSKITQEMLALQYHLVHNLDVVILRPFNHTGPGQTTDFVVPQLAKQFVAVENGEADTVQLGNLQTIRDFTDVRDIVVAYVLAAKHGKSGEVYNIGSGQGITILEIVDMFQKITGKTVELKTKNEAVRRSDVPVLIADASKFKKLTDWEPKIKLEKTISDILAYWRSNYVEHNK